MILNVINLIAALVICAKVVAICNRGSFKRTRFAYLGPVFLFGLAAAGVGLAPFFFVSWAVTPPALAFTVTAALAVWACARSRPRRRFRRKGVLTHGTN